MLPFYDGMDSVTSDAYHCHSKFVRSRFFMCVLCEGQKHGKKKCCYRYWVDVLEMTSSTWESFNGFEVVRWIVLDCVGGRTMKLLPMNMASMTTQRQEQQQRAAII